MIFSQLSIAATLFGLHALAGPIPNTEQATTTATAEFDAEAAVDKAFAKWWKGSENYFWQPPETRHENVYAGGNPIEPIWEKRAANAEQEAESENPTPTKRTYPEYLHQFEAPEAGSETEGEDEPTLTKRQDWRFHRFALPTNMALFEEKLAAMAAAAWADPEHPPWERATAIPVPEPGSSGV